MIFKGNSPDRRRRQRQLLNTSVQVFTGSTRVDALGINLSDVGMCLFAIANLPLGSEVHVEFLPPRGKERIRVCATVRHRAFYLYGVEFLMDSEQPDGGWVEVGTGQEAAQSE
jgi:PilZ domain